MPAPPAPPDPLRLFAAHAAALAAELQEVDAASADLYRRITASADRAPDPEPARVDFTYQTNALEGSTLTLRETALVLEGFAPPGGKPLREVYEARNHDRALRHMEAHLQSGGPIDAALMLELHRLVLTDIAPDASGRPRTERVRIGGARHIPPGHHRFDALLDHAFALANGADAHPVLRAAELHYNLAAIHPFLDGNGRTARLISNAVLLSAGHPLSPVRIEQRPAYLTALDAANTGDTEPFARLITATVLRAHADLAP